MAYFGPTYNGGAVVGAINARLYGATGNGVSNDTSALQRALNAAAALDSAVVHIPAGVYMIDTTLVVGSNTKVVGDGVGVTTIRGIGAAYTPHLDTGTPAYAALAAIGKTHVTIEGLTVDHETNATAANGIVFIPDGNLRTVTFTHATETVNLASHGMATGYGPLNLLTTGTLPTGLEANTNYWWISTGAGTGQLATSLADALAETEVTFSTDGTGAHTLAAPFSGTVCTYCEVRNCEVIASHTANYQIWSMRGQHIKFVNNRVDGYWSGDAMPAVGQEGIEAFGGEYVLIHGNEIRRLGGAGINVGATGTGYDATDIVGLTITDNFVVSCRSGIVGASSYDAVAGAQNLTDVLIGGNVVRGSLAHGIRVYTPVAGTTLTDVRISGNVVDTADVCIEVYGIDSDTGHKGVVVADNVVRNAATVTQGIITAFFIPNLSIVDNVMDTSAGYGLWLADCDDLRVSGNLVDGTQLTGLTADDCDDLTVVSNTFRNHNGGGASNGILLINCARGCVNDNVFDQSATAGTEVNVASSCTSIEMLRNSTLYVPTSTGAAVFSNSSAISRNPPIAARMEVYSAIAVVASTGIHAAVASNAANAFPGPITDPAIPRNLLAAFQASYDGGDLTVVGTDQFGRAVTDTITANAGGTAQTTKIFKTITSITKATVGATANTVTLGPGPKIGLNDRTSSSSTLMLLARYTAGVPTLLLGTLDATYHGWTCGSENPNGNNWMVVYPVQG